jgi:hypothetical protein
MGSRARARARTLLVGAGVTHIGGYIRSIVSQSQVARSDFDGIDAIPVQAAEICRAVQVHGANREINI